MASHRLTRVRRTKPLTSAKLVLLLTTCLVLLLSDAIAPTGAGVLAAAAPTGATRSAAPSSSKAFTTSEPLPPVPADSVYATLGALDASAAAAASSSRQRHHHPGSDGAASPAHVQAGRSAPPANFHHDFAFYSVYFEELARRSGSAEDMEEEAQRGNDGGSHRSDAGMRGRHVNEAALVAATPSPCSARAGCPRSSMVWASGSLTLPELLTPTTFLMEANATLQLSLCCDYLYDGKMLRRPDLYRTFLRELLHASPLQVLTDEEKEQLFPRRKAFLVDPTARRVFHAETVLTARERAKHNNGDGSVLVLVTGKLDFAAVSRVFVTAASSPLYRRSARGSDPASLEAAAAMGESEAPREGARPTRRQDEQGSGGTAATLTNDVRPFLSGRSGRAGAAAAPAERDEDVRTGSLRPPPSDRQDDSEESAVPVNVLSTDVQLRITNQVLKCKCPHTLLVMPLLKLRPDRLPPIEILGVGPHCAQKPTETLSASAKATRAARATPFRHVVRISSREGDDPHAAQYATTFLVAPALPPGTRVTWTVSKLLPPLGSPTRSGSSGDGEVVLQHVQTLPAMVRAVQDAEAGGKESVALSHAPSPYVVVEPNVKYAVHVRAERVGGRLVEESRGVFVLRRSFHRAWPLPPLDVKPHFGFDRQLRLNTTTTLRHAEVGDALRPKQGWPVTALDTTRFDYYGYFENVPLSNQPVPQRYVSRAYNPFARDGARASSAAAPPAVSFPLFFGRNLLAYAVRDIDDVCDPVVLEEREYWAVQSILRTENPVTACGPTQDVEAMLVRHVLHTMREKKGMAVNVPHTSWAPLPVPEEGREGNYTCRRRRGVGKRAGENKRPSPAVYDGTCDAAITFPGGISGTTARLHLPRRGVYDVEWVVHVAVADSAVLAPDNMDAAYAASLPLGGGGGTAAASPRLVQIRSRVHHVVRRVSSYPARVPLQLPMHARRFLVSPPSPLPPSDLVDASGTRRKSRSFFATAVTGDDDDDHEESPTGYWITHSPLRTRSIDERLNLEMDTSNVPNVHQTLPNASLVYVAQDHGEDLSAAYGIAYTSRCPDILVEYVVNVVAMHAPPIVPAFVPIYTEDDCVVLEPPRPARKDEVVEWRVRDCPDASHPPHVVERVIAVEEQSYRSSGSSSSGSSSDVEEGGRRAGSDAERVPGAPQVVVLACGIEVYKRCEVEWTATNLVATVAKTYSLRRCQRPPEVLFHKNGLQRGDGVPSLLFALPSVRETFYLPDTAASSPESVEGLAAPHLLRERTRLRSIIPIAGYAAEVGYSFNYTAGPQNHFEATITPVPEEAANELLYTQAHSPHHPLLHRRDPTRAVHDIVWRRRTRHDLTPASSGKARTPRQDRDAEEGEAEEESAEDVATLARNRFLFRNRDDSVLGANGRLANDYYGMYDGDSEGDAEDMMFLVPFWAAYEQRPHDAGGSEESGRVETERRADEGGGGSSSSSSSNRHRQPYSTRTAHSPADDFTHWQAVRMARYLRRRDAAIDAAINEHLLMRHSLTRRELSFEELANSSLYPLDYVVQASTRHAPSTAALQEDRREFQRRNMCVARRGHTALLAVNPLGVVAMDARRGRPPPPPPAVAILPFCAPELIFSRHPHLHRMYGYDFTWDCEDSSVIAVDKKEPTYTVLTHAAGKGGGASAKATLNETNCRLTVKNDITDTVKADWFLVRRVYPTVPAFTHFIVLSDNAASLPMDSDGAEDGRKPPQRMAHAQSRTPSSPSASPSSQQMLTRRIYGKSAVLHVDGPSSPRNAYWQVLSVVPAVSDRHAAGSRMLRDGVHFAALWRHPGAVARGRGGSTVLVKGLDTPGVYTIAHVMLDPRYPALCPNVSFVEAIEVLHAQVLEKEIYICGATAALRAVPIPKELQTEFMGTWEIISLQTAEDEVWTSGVNFTGIHFEHGRSADTLVHGLPFGVVTIRWSVYKLLSAHGEAESGSASGTQTFAHGTTRPAPTAASHRILVDYDTVRVMVLTENLHTHRLVTLADSVDILTTSSTQDWHIAAEYYATDFSDNDGSSGGAFRGSNGKGSPTNRPILRGHALLNYSFLGFGEEPHVQRHADGDDAAAASASADMDPLLFPYYGPSPRRGAGLLTVSPLSTGSLHLGYTLRPSANLFGPMIGHSCELRGIFEIERVSAFLSAQTTLDHECDSYTGEGEIVLCLHAKASPSRVTAAGDRTRAAKATAQEKKARKKSTTKDGAANPRRELAAWESRLRLVDPGRLEEVIKRGAREVAQRGCVTPWWVWPSTHWGQVRLVEAPTMPVAGRCVAFTVTAGRHLAPREVSHPLFTATPSHARADTPRRSDPQQPQHQRRRLPDAPQGQLQRGGVCGLGDFITSRVIEGAAPPLSQGGGGGGHKNRESPSFFSRLYKSSGSGSGGSGSARASWVGPHGGLRYLPVLHPDTLTRHTGIGMRPMIGQQGLPDEIALETNVSRGNESVVTLRLDLSLPRQLGGYVTHTATGHPSSPSTPPSHFRSPLLQVARLSLLLACVEGSVRAGDVLQYWSEVNRPDGAVDRTAEEWVEYAQAVKETRVPCDVLFVSLQHLLAKAHKAIASGTRLGSGTDAALALPIANRRSGGGDNGDAGVAARLSQGSFEDSDEALSAAAASLRRRGAVPGPGGGVLSTQQRLVPLDVVEQQLESIQMAYTRTRDGIDVTGLRSDLQEALQRRRVTKRQLKEIEEARRVQRERAERAAHEQQQGLLVGGAQAHGSTPPIVVSQKERLLEALKLYKRVAAAGGDDREVVAAIRIRLPRYEPFVVPYNMFLRTAMHKDVICGTNISATADLSSPLVAVPPPNPYSTVAMGRVEIVDVPATVAPQPHVVKQCEVEGNMPVLSLNLTGARYAVGAFTASSVLLEEIPNPDLPPRLRTQRQREIDERNEVGLTPCIPELTGGMDVVVARATLKHLHIHLNACPSFRMLAPEEYNEQQDTEELLQRLQYPRLLRVTVKNALKPDSFTDTHGAGRPVSPPVLSGNPMNHSRSSRLGLDADAGMVLPHNVYSDRPPQTSSLRDLKTSLDVSFVVRVVPTIALLHLRGGKTEASREGVATRRGQASSTPLGLGRGGGTFLKGGFKANSARPLVLCERDMRREGFELGVELLGDHWTPPVGEIRADGSEDSAAVDADDDRDALSAGSYRHHNPYARRRDRSAANVAMLNSFSIVEHYTLASAHHLFLKGAGVYRSHFVNYLFSTVLGDAEVLQNHPFIRRFNSTFVAIAVPPQPLSASRQGTQGGGASWWRGGAQQQLSSLWLEEVDVDAVEGLMGVSATEDMYLHGTGSRGAASPSSASSVPFQLPAVRRFSKIEEILFAVPGIATECRGCLLADTTFFVAGDLTGLWSFPGYYSGASSTSASPSLSNTAARRRAVLAAGGPQLPTALPPLDNAILTRPLVLPSHEAGAIPRTWQLHWMCPSAAHTALNAFFRLWESMRRGHHHRPDVKHRRDPAPLSAASLNAAAGLGDATMHVEVVLYTAHDTAGAVLPASQRPVTLLKSEGVPLSRVIAAAAANANSDRGPVFAVKESAADAAFTTLAADYLRHRRPGSAAVGLAPAFRYHKEERFANHLMAVNASVFLKLCVPLPTTSPAPASATPPSCMVVSVTDSLITVEAPKAPRKPSLLWKAAKLLLGLEDTAKAVPANRVLDLDDDPSDGSLYGFLTGKRTGRRGGFTLAALLHHVFLAIVFYLILPALSVDAASRSNRGRGDGGRDGGGEALRDVDASRVRPSFTVSGLLASSGFGSSGAYGERSSSMYDAGEDGVDLAQEAGAQEARVAFTVMFLVCVVFAYAYVPVAWLVVALALWSYVMYKATDGLVLLTFVGYALYWHLFM